MNGSEESKGPPHALGGTALSIQENSPAGESGYAGARQSSNWAWATLHTQYDWMDSHTLSGELDQL
jgi:hypothetical protein